MSEVLENFEKEKAAAYDDRFVKLAAFKDALHLVVQLALRRLPETAEILVVGAGTGAELLFLAERFPGWHFTAVDPSADMLEICRAKLEQRDLASRCTLVCGYLEELPLQQKFDGATSLLVSQFILDREKRCDFFRAIHHRLKPGGRLVTADLGNCGEDGPEVWRLWKQALEHVGCTADEIEGYVAQTGKGVGFLTDSEMKELLGEAGFSNPTHCFQTLLINGWSADGN